MAEKNVSTAEVQKIAHLSKLHFEEKELENLTHDFNQILHFVDQINEVNTDNVKPLYHVLELTNVRREDTIDNTRNMQMNEIKKIAPKFEAGFIVVPRVLD